MNVYNRQYLIVKEGDLITLSSGEYSDYQVHTLCRVLKNVDLKEILRKYSEKYGRRYEWSDTSFIDADGFLATLIKDQIVEEVEYKEFFIGSLI